MTLSASGDFVPGPTRDHATILITMAFAAIPERERFAFIKLFDRWRSWPPDRRAILAKTLCPDLSDAEVAAMSGISRRHLYRLPTYQAFKPRLADFKASMPRADSSKRRGFQAPGTPLA